MTDYVSLRFLTLPTDRTDKCDEIVATLQSAMSLVPGAISSWIGPVVPGPVIHAGHIVWRSKFASENDAMLAPFCPAWREQIEPLLCGVHISGVGYRTTRRGTQKAKPKIWRALVFRTFSNAEPALIKDLEDRLLLFPRYIRTIKSWCLGEVTGHEGPKSYTHVWEQEFESIDGLLGEYMNHPLHWGVVDSYFDAEVPEYIVDGHVIQAIVEIDNSIM